MKLIIYPKDFSLFFFISNLSLIYIPYIPYILKTNEREISLKGSTMIASVGKSK